MPPPVPLDADSVELTDVVDLGTAPLVPSDIDTRLPTDSAGTTRPESKPRIDGFARVAARERALGLLYEAEVRGATVTDLLATLPIRPDEFAVFLVTGVASTTESLDSELARVSRHWELGRMPALDRAILRIGTFELRDCPETPTAVIINEAVELAKRFSTDDSGRFVNGVLSRLASDLRS